MVLLRFAPSPTGALHLGGLRTALYNHLYAKKLGGKWLLRIEDTDATRYVPHSVDGIRNALSWAGLEYDYGPGKGGPHAPYFQSERLDLYHSYTNKLLDSGHAYRCFCTPDHLNATRERLARTGSNTTYDKTCLHLTEEEVARKVRAGEKSIVRLNDDGLPPRSTVSDLVFGSWKDTHASLPTDPVLLKSDLFPTYHLASVIDDHEMGITHVLRGEEWIPSLPLHLDLYACLSLTPPEYAHIPILLNPDGTKMSKRNGDVQVIDYIKRGWEPEALLNWLALAGWGAAHDPSPSSVDSTSPSKAATAPDSTQIMTMDEIIGQFDLSSLTHRRNSLDPIKLEYLNKHHLMRKWSTKEGLEALAKNIYPLIKEAFPRSQYRSIQDIMKFILILESRFTTVTDIPTTGPFFFLDPDLSSDEAQSMIKPFSATDRQTILDSVSHRLEPTAATSEAWDRLNIADIIHDERAKLSVNNKMFMSVLRHALSGMKKGPSVPEIAKGLGRERTLARLKTARP